MKAPRGTLQKDVSHISVELFSLERSSSRLTNGGEIERHWLLLTLSVVMTKSVTLGFHHKMRSMCAHFLSVPLFRRTGLLLEYKIS